MARNKLRFAHGLVRPTLLALVAVTAAAGCGGAVDGYDDSASSLVQAAVVAPRTIFLNFAGANCGYGTLDECKRKLQGILDGWYADFNVVFTHTQPASGPFYKVDVSFNGSAGSGASQLSCNDQFGTPIICRAQVGGARALVSNAGTIAHEHGHAVGLHHSDGATDIMNQRADNNSAGFEDKDNNLLDNKHCRSTQNSYRLMLERLGPWPGGCKSGPYGEFCPKGAGPANPSGGSGGTVANAGGAGGNAGGAGAGGSAGSSSGITGGAGGGAGNSSDGNTAPDLQPGGGQGSTPDPKGGAKGGASVGVDEETSTDDEREGEPEAGGCSFAPRNEVASAPTVFGLALFLFWARVGRWRRRPNV